MGEEVCEYKITDDSGFLAIFDPAAYLSFVDADWSFEQLIEHFQAEMGEGHLLLWRTGREGIWRIKVVRGRSEDEGFREVVGPIQVVGGRLCLTNYECLTMGAGSSSVTLPMPHEAGNEITLADGIYSCRIVQLFDPFEFDEDEDGDEDEDERDADFLIELHASDDPGEPWSSIPWDES